MGRPRGEPLRVLHCPAAVGGHAVGLARAERELGVASRTVSFHPSPFGFGEDEVLFLAGSSRLSREARRWSFLRRVLREFDVVHFNFGSSILPRPTPPALPAPNGAARGLYDLYARLVEFRDLALLARRGKGIFVTYQGDDARHGELWRSRLSREAGEDYYPPARDAYRRRGIAAFDRYAHGIYALNPDLLDLLPSRAEFLPYASVDPREHRPTELGQGRQAVVLHAPTDRRVKGTGYLIDAVQQLRRDGVELELVLVEGLSHAEALEAYRRGDLLVDQLLAGWYGGVAVELMALGKPVVAHIRASDLGRIPSEMRAGLPVVDATPDTIAGVLRELLTVRRAELAELGRRSRAFAERWHDPRTIAARTVEDYERSLTPVSRSR